MFCKAFLKWFFIKLHKSYYLSYNATTFINVFFDYTLYIKFVRHYNLLRFKQTFFQGAATFEGAASISFLGGGYFRVF